MLRRESSAARLGCAGHLSLARDRLGRSCRSAEGRVSSAPSMIAPSSQTARTRRARRPYRHDARARCPRRRSCGPSSTRSRRRRRACAAPAHAAPSSAIVSARRSRVVCTASRLRLEAGRDVERVPADADRHGAPSPAPRWRARCPPQTEPMGSATSHLEAHERPPVAAPPRTPPRAAGRPAKARADGRVAHEAQAESFTNWATVPIVSSPEGGSPAAIAGGRSPTSVAEPPSWRCAAEGQLHGRERHASWAPLAERRGASDERRRGGSLPRSAGGCRAR